VIVTCERCATQFRLDDTKVPPQGVRVRCSRCKHAFFVEAPGGAEGERVHSVVEEAVAGKPRSAPEVTQDLCVSAERGAGSAEPALDAGDGASGSDWEFSDDIPGSSVLDEEKPEPLHGLAAAREAVDDLLGPAPGESGAAAQGPERPPEKVVGPSDEADAVVDQLLAGAVGQDAEEDLELDLAPEAAPGSFSGGDLLAAQPGAPDWAAEASAGEPDWAAEAPAGESEGAEDTSVGESDGAEEASASEPAQGEELDSPDAWDFFAGGGAEGAGSADSGRVAVGSVRPVPASALEDGGGESAQAEQASSQRDTAPPVELAAGASAGSARLRRVANGAGWAVTAALCLVVLYGGLAARSPERGAVVDSQRLAGIEAASVEGRWLENAATGPIYVVEGDLRRSTPAGGPLGAQLEVQLLDAAGAAIGAAAAAVGPAIPVGRLHEQDPRSLMEAQERAAPQLARARLAPGQRLPFHAVFAELPSEAKGFRMQVHSVPAALEMAEPDPEADSDVSEAGSVGLEASSSVPEAGSAGLEASSSVPEAGSVSLETDSSVSEAGSVSLETDSSVSEAGSVGLEASSSVPEAGSVSLETDSSVSEAGSVSLENGSLFPDE
jgi:predicted Zn finger-like uncharacterized protein